MKPLLAVTACFAACAAIVGSTYVLIVLARVARAGGTTLGGDVIAIVYAVLVIGATLALPALRSGVHWLHRTGAVVGSANLAMLLFWAILNLGGWVISHEAMMRAR